MGQDIKMSAFAPATDGAYIYAESADGSQVKIKKDDLMERSGLFRYYSKVKAGDTLVLPYSSGLIIIQNASNVFDKACAILFANNTGVVLNSNSNINFFSNVSGKVCVLNTGTNTNYIVKNSFSIDLVLSIVLIG